MTTKKEDFEYQGESWTMNIQGGGTTGLIWVTHPKLGSSGKTQLGNSYRSPLSLASEIVKKNDA